MTTDHRTRPMIGFFNYRNRSGMIDLRCKYTIKFRNTY